MARNRKDKIPYKHIYKAGEKVRDAARRLRQIKQTFQATNENKKRLDPNAVQTHPRQQTRPIRNLEELLSREIPFVASNDDDDAYYFCDYCINALMCLQHIIEVLSTKTLTSDAIKLVDGQLPNVMSAEETRRLRELRSVWYDYLKVNLTTLWTPPPASGGATARYSFAVQLWLLITHASVALQRSNAVNELFDFVPSDSGYLTRNDLIIETGPLMQFKLRTLVMSIDHFVGQLESIDRYHPDYTRYETALMNLISEKICEVGNSFEYNAMEWCVSHGAREKAEEEAILNKKGTLAAEKKKNKNAASKKDKPNLKEGQEQVSDEFILWSMIMMLTINHHAEVWFRLTRFQLPSGVMQHTRVPAHVVANSQWVVSNRSIRAFSQTLCEYTHDLVDEVYSKSLRTYLLQFVVMPSDMNFVRAWNKHDQVFTRSVLQFPFKGRSEVARAYLRKVFYERPVYDYLIEVFQWESGDEITTQSGSLAGQNFIRQMTVLFVFDQLMSRFRFPWKQRCVLMHRDTAALNTYERLLTFGMPVVISQFNRFALFVPHKRDPNLDYAEIMAWRANSRRTAAIQSGKRNKSLLDYYKRAEMDFAHASRTLALAEDQLQAVDYVPLPAEQTTVPASDNIIQPGERPLTLAESNKVLANYASRQYHRVYDFLTASEAIANWCLWLLQLRDGKIDKLTDLREFILDGFGWHKQLIPENASDPQG